MNNHTVLKVKDPNAKLTISQLAEALFEGTPHLQNLAEKLARQHGQAGALTFFHMMGEDIRNFYMGIAQQLIDHAASWQPNDGSACICSEEERKRLVMLPRHPDLYTAEAGFKYVQAERNRVVNVLKITEAMDDEYIEEQLYKAGEGYLQNYDRPGDVEIPPFWPWAAIWWKPTKGTKAGNIKQLAKAGALFMAEVGRLERAGAENYVNEITRSRTLMGW